MWICVTSAAALRCQAEGVDRPPQVGGLVGPAQGEPFPQSGLVDLDDGQARRLEIFHLVSNGQGDLPASLFPGWSSRTNDHCSMVTGPVSIPFTGFWVRLAA